MLTADAASRAAPFRSASRSSSVTSSPSAELSLVVQRSAGSSSSAEPAPANDEIKNHLGSGRPIRSRTPEGVRQELRASLAVHQAISQFAHTAALARPVPDVDRVSYLGRVRIIRRISSQLRGRSPSQTVASSFPMAEISLRVALARPFRSRTCWRQGSALSAGAFHVLQWLRPAVPGAFAGQCSCFCLASNCCDEWAVPVLGSAHEDHCAVSG